MNSITAIIAGRIIPAYAGKTLSSSSIRLSTLGSSPLTRGKQDLAVSAEMAVGIIPAYAGKTNLYVTYLIASKDHPRLRGENSAHRPIVSLDKGSSPLTRGKHEEYPGTLREARIIPAYAGKTASRSCAEYGNQDHPRLRGENFR